MSQNSNLLKHTLDLLETDPEIKSYIYQQIHDFGPFVTPETMVMVLARDPEISYSSELETESVDEQMEFEEHEKEALAAHYKYRIVIILKEGDSSIEAEAFHNDIYEAIRLAKEKLLARLIEIRDEVESPQERMKAIREASDNTQIH